MKEISFKYRHKLISFLLDRDVKGLRRLASILPYKIIPKPEGKYILKTTKGVKLIIDPVLDNGVEKSLYYTGTYEKGTLSQLKKMLKKGGTFVDVGANIGLMSILASKYVGKEGRVICFEPNPSTREILFKNIALNNCNNIEVLSYALGSKQGFATLYDRWDVNRGGASLIPSEKDEESASSYVVGIERLDEILHNERMDVLKIDVEGYELEALKGAAKILSNINKPKLIIECTEETENELHSRSAIYDFLKSVNYSIYKLKGSKERKSKLIKIKSEEDLPTHDNLFCS